MSALAREDLLDSSESEIACFQQAGGGARGNVDFTGGRCMRHRSIDPCRGACKVLTLWAEGKRSGRVCWGGVAVGVAGTRGKVGSSTGVIFTNQNGRKHSFRPATVRNVHWRFALHRLDASKALSGLARTG